MFAKETLTWSKFVPNLSYFRSTRKHSNRMRTAHFLGGLSLHLNHLIASHMANYDWPFGTLPFGLFGSNLDTSTLRHILGPILVILKYVNF